MNLREEKGNERVLGVRVNLVLLLLLLFSWKGPRSVYSSSRTSLEHIQFKFDVDNRKLTRDKIFAFHHTPTKARVEGAETQTNN